MPVQIDLFPQNFKLTNNPLDTLTVDASPFCGISSPFGEDPLTWIPAAIDAIINDFRRFAADATKTLGKWFPTAIPGLDASKIIQGTFAISFIPDLQVTWNSIVNAFQGAITGQYGAVIGDVETALRNIPGANIVGEIAADVIIGILSATNIPGLDASKIIQGTFSNSFVPGIQQLWNVITSSMNVTNSGSGGNALITDVEHALTNIPGGNIAGQIAADVITGIISATSIPGLDASKIIQGTFSNSFVPGLQQTWNAINNALNNPASGSGGNALITDVEHALSNIPGVNIVSQVLESVIPPLTSGWGGSIVGEVINGALTNATIAGSALTSAITNQNFIPALTNTWAHTIDGTLISGGQLATSVIPPITAAMTTGLAYTDTIVQALTGTSGTGNPQSAITGALQNIPHTCVLGPWIGDVGVALQSHVDAGVQGITAGTATGNSLAIFQTAMSALTNFLGYTTRGTPPANSVAAQSQSNQITLANQAVNKPLQGAVDPTTDGPFDLSQLMTNSTLPTIAVAQANSAICFVSTVNAGVKQSIRWMGYITGTLTGFYVNVYQLNTTTGVCTLVYSSPNIFGAVGSGSVPVWNALNLAAANYITTAQGTIYAIELAVTGGGSYNVVGAINYLPTHPTAIPAKYGALRNPPAVTFDAAGAGGTGTGTTVNFSWPHTITGNCLIVAVALYTAGSSTGETVKVGSTTVPVIGSYNYAANSYVHFWGMMNPPTGPQTISLSYNGSAAQYVAAASVSYFNAGSIATALGSNTGTGTAATQTVAAALGQMIVQAFTNNGAANFSGYNQNQRANISFVSGVNNTLLVGDAPGAASVVFNATASASVAWGAASVIVSPAAALPPAPPTFTPVYSNNTPWLGLAGTAGTTTYTPVLVPITASGNFDPSGYQWANYFDVVICSGGGGSASGSGSNGTPGSAHGNWAAITYTKAQMGSAPVPFTIGAGGIGGGPGFSQPGSNGGNSTASVPGQTTLTAAGGAYVGGSTGNQYAGAGQGMPDLVYDDHYGNPHTYHGGAGGASGQQSGQQPGGGGAGGNANYVGNTNGGYGGAGIGYVYVYQ